MKSYYREERKMDPRDGNKFSTTYYKQEKSEKEKLDGFINRSWRECQKHRDAGNEVTDWLNEPMKSHRHRRKDGSYYTRGDAINDANTHCVMKGHDLTESILNRWNHAWEGVDVKQIEMTQGARPNNMFNQLMEEHNDRA